MQYEYSRKVLHHPETKPVFIGVDHMPAFDDQAAGFSLVNAWWCSNMSHLAYSEKPEVEQALAKVGFQLVEFFSGNSTQGFLAINDHTAILSFRGTESDEIEDIIADARLFLHPFTEGGRVHKGFLQALDEVWEQVASSLEALEGHIRLWYTGHSLGAVLATLSAARRKPDGLVTFGSPLLGNEAFTKLLQGVPVHRFVNCTDIVATVPPVAFGYEHVGRPFFLTARGKLLIHPSRWTMIRHKVSGELGYAARFPWFRPGMVKVRSFVDHAILNYTEGIRRALKRATG